MIRLTYISRFSRPIDTKEIQEIAQVSRRNNALVGLTGILFTFRDVFYQVLEGDEIAVDATYRRIVNDPRHEQIFRLGTERDIQVREYAEWNMNLVRLDDSTEKLYQPMRAMLGSLARTHSDLRLYTPREILTSVQAGKNPVEIEPEDRRLVILFVDLKGSTRLHETLSTDRMTAILSAFYENTIGIIEAMGGTVSKLLGDGLMAYFDDDGQALSAALRIQEFFHERRQGGSRGSSLIQSGIGVSAGRARIGNIGSRTRKDFTILGDPVNTAARLEALTRKLPSNIVFDESVDTRKLPKTVPLWALGSARLRGKLKPVKLFSFRVPAVMWPRVRKKNTKTSARAARPLSVVSG